MNAHETIINLIKNKVTVMNNLIRSDDQNTESFKRRRHELKGMMVCLRNITTEDIFYCTIFHDDRIEFGFYDESGHWIVLV